MPVLDMDFGVEQSRRLLALALSDAYNTPIRPDSVVFGSTRVGKDLDITVTANLDEANLKFSRAEIVTVVKNWLDKGWGAKATVKAFSKDNGDYADDATQIAFTGLNISDITIETAASLSAKLRDMNPPKISAGASPEA